MNAQDNPIPVGYQIRVMLPSDWRERRERGWSGRLYRATYSTRPGDLRLRANPPFEGAADQTTLVRAAGELLAKVTPEALGIPVARDIGSGAMGLLLRHSYRTPQGKMFDIWVAAGDLGTITGTFDTGAPETAERERADAHLIMQSAYLHEFDLTGLHMSRDTDFATVIEQVPSDGLNVADVAGWEDASNYDDPAAPYEMRRHCLHGTESLRLWCAKNTPTRVPVDSPQSLLDFLRRRADGLDPQREWLANADQREDGALTAMLIVTSKDGSVDGFWMLANTQRYFYAELTLAHPDCLDLVMRECSTLVLGAPLGEPA